MLEDRDKVKKVKYNSSTKGLEYSESVEIGIAISVAINDEIRKSTDLEEKSNLFNDMRETYY